MTAVDTKGLQFVPHLDLEDKYYFGSKLRRTWYEYGYLVICHSIPPTLTIELKFDLPRFNLKSRLKGLPNGEALVEAITSKLGTVHTISGNGPIKKDKFDELGLCLGCVTFLPKEKLKRCRPTGDTAGLCEHCFSLLKGEIEKKEESRNYSVKHAKLGHDLTISDYNDAIKAIPYSKCYLCRNLIPVGSNGYRFVRNYDVKSVTDPGLLRSLRSIYKFAICEVCMNYLEGHNEPIEIQGWKYLVSINKVIFDVEAKGIDRVLPVLLKNINRCGREREAFIFDFMYDLFVFGFLDELLEYKKSMETVLDMIYPLPDDAKRTVKQIRNIIKTQPEEFIKYLLIAILPSDEPPTDHINHPTWPSIVDLVVDEVDGPEPRAMMFPALRTNVGTMVAIPPTELRI